MFLEVATIAANERGKSFHEMIDHFYRLIALNSVLFFFFLIFIFSFEFSLFFFFLNIKALSDKLLSFHRHVKNYYEHLMTYLI